MNNEIESALEKAWEKDGNRVIRNAILMLIGAMAIAFGFALIVCRNP